MKSINFLLMLLCTLVLLPDLVFAEKLLCALPRVVCTSEMNANVEATEGLGELLDILTIAGIKTNSLRDALNENRIHQEGADAGGILLIGSGVELSPKLVPT